MGPAEFAKFSGPVQPWCHSESADPELPDLIRVCNRIDRNIILELTFASLHIFPQAVICGIADF
jgi:hypothetical protein